MQLEHLQKRKRFYNHSNFSKPSNNIKNQTFYPKIQQKGEIVQKHVEDRRTEKRKPEVLKKYKYSFIENPEY